MVREIPTTQDQQQRPLLRLRCNRCLQPLAGSTPVDGTCGCGGMIEAASMAEEAAH